MGADCARTVPLAAHTMAIKDATNAILCSKRGLPVAAFECRLSF
jgi:hypothetical protein